MYKEAFAVGAAFIPMLFLVSKATTAFKISGEVKPYVDGAITGFLFHIAAEETGLNGWYLTESYAANKVLWENKYVSTQHGSVGGLSGLGPLVLPPQILSLFQHTSH